MSKKPKRSRHRIPTLAIRSDPVTDDYQAEIDASMERLARRHARAQKAAEAAELKAERARQHAENLERKHAEAERIAANKAAEANRSGEYVERIKEAAKNARVGQARAEAEARQQAARRQIEAQERLRREQDIASARNRYSLLEAEAAQRRQEVREIEALMMPGNYAGRDHRGRGTARHTTGDAA